ncbi:DinB family protein [Promicromonospora sukumoe]|uniref:Putative damage-inducible protein DinB n=1 Tax=Promicromonospora sukumoe TaxID=88382 RepID=A0A7W3PGX8_9MICO|nr:DinB family protein [Promicromonospora sukumoe]MBA8811152.1 putative damage-inducible protein DinB [Promicromonospora sukumoe]
MTTERWTSATVYPDMWADPDDDPREALSNPVGEKETLWNYLKHYRLTLEMKCEGLDAEQLARRSVPPSTMSLLGLVRHLAHVEQTWFQRVLREQPELPKLFGKSENPDADFDGAVADPAVVEDAWENWRREVRDADTWMEGLPEDGLGATVTRGDEQIPVRDVLVHMIEEYSRHVGHADLLRECVDGRVGQ